MCPIITDIKFVAARSFSVPFNPEVTAFGSLARVAVLRAVFADMPLARAYTVDGMGMTQRLPVDLTAPGSEATRRLAVRSEIPWIAAYSFTLTEL